MSVKLPLVSFLFSSQVVIVVSCAIGVYALFNYYNGRLLPNTKINGVEVSGLTIEEAVPILQAESPAVPETSVVLKVDDIAVASGSGELGLHYDFDSTAQAAYLEGKQGSLPKRLLKLMIAAIKPTTHEAPLTFDKEKITNLITQLKLRTDIIGEQPRAILKTTNNPDSLTVMRGLPGRVVEMEKTLSLIEASARAHTFTLMAPVASTSASLSDEQMLVAYDRAKHLVGKSVVFSDDSDPSLKVTANDIELVSLLLFPTGLEQTEIAALADAWAAQLNRPAQDAVLEYDKETLKVTTFSPDKEGVEVKKEELKQAIETVVTEIETIAKQDSSKSVSKTPQSDLEPDSQNEHLVFTKPLPTQKTKPTKPLAATNNLGITKRIGYGESEYAHSIPNRVHNVKITTDRISNIIIPPDTEFSFNKILGEVSARTGYRSAYVIKNGRTELGDGGGVCQVSTTVFRSVLNAGLPVTKRIPHSYRVSYYELDSKPGIDATVYSGNIDFRFKNDTGHHILLHAEADSQKLTMFVELYGTSDGRTTQIVDHITWGYQSPPPAEYYPDPSLAPGTRKQIDWAAAGIKAKFKNIVKDASGEVVREEEYVSNYKPWSAKYLVGP